MEYPGLQTHREDEQFGVPWEVSEGRTDELALKHVDVHSSPAYAEIIKQVHEYHCAIDVPKSKMRPIMIYILDQ